ncbi:MAG: RNA polymerase sigma factor [Micromonosporaceae bacterium]|nr:RNA polymerase sigma factor [Micromonosporaceae bacterium]
MAAVAIDQSLPSARIESFEDFYRAQADRVYRALALTVGDPELARDATAEAMARAYARWSHVSRVDNPGGWVYRVGLNWATSRWRRRRREHPLPADLDPAAAPMDVDAVAALAALRRLDTRSRAVVVCRVLLDMSTAQTAAALDIAEGPVKSRLARALATLRASLIEKTP